VRFALHQLNTATHIIVATLALKDVVLHLMTMLSPSFIVPSAVGIIERYMIYLVSDYGICMETQELSSYCNYYSLACTGEDPSAPDLFLRNVCIKYFTSGEQICEFDGSTEPNTP